jgi:signal peptidase I
MSFAKELKKYLDRFWFLVWKDESFTGWALSIIFIFIFIKFIFFPVLSLLTGTPLPLAIVESCSMYHEKDLLGNFDNWFDEHENKYSEFEIEKPEFGDFGFKKGFNKGDILFITGVKPENIEIGDVIIFSSPVGHPIIHRVIEVKNESGVLKFSTIGDNNSGQLTIEKDILSSSVIGKARIKLVPLAGWIKLVFFEAGKSNSERGFCN